MNQNLVIEALLQEPPEPALSQLFPERLRAVRNGRGLSQRELGRRAGVTNPAIARFEMGRQLPTIETVRRLSGALKTTTDYLLGMTDDPSLRTRQSQFIRSSLVPVEIHSYPEKQDRTQNSPTTKRNENAPKRVGRLWNSSISLPTGSSLTYRIVEDLGIAIVTGQYLERSPFFVEDDLSKYYCVGRAILREAVKILTDKGLLGSMPHRGTWVQPEQNWNMLDSDVLRWTLGGARSLPLLIELMQMRLAVEPHAAGLAARSASTPERAAVAGAMERMIAADADDNDMLSSDIAFHVAVMRASGNRFYAQHCSLVEMALRHSFRTTMQFRGEQTISVADHKRVADAILASDAPTAEAAMHRLIKDSLNVICSLDASFRLPASSGEPIDML